MREREIQFDLTDYEDALCPQCGQLRTVCEDPDAIWNPQVHACQLTAARSMFARQWHKRFEKVKPDGDGWLPTDGALVYASQEPADPDFYAKPFTIRDPELGDDG